MFVLTVNTISNIIVNSIDIQRDDASHWKSLNFRGNTSSIDVAVLHKLHKE
jgi:hypothetical protein